MARPRKPYKDDPVAVSITDMGDYIAKSLAAVAEKPNLHGYNPHSKQIEFHSSQAKNRWFLGGNRSGKSVAGVVEDLWWVSKKHPYRRIPAETEIRGRVVISDFNAGMRTVLFPIFKQWILPSMLHNGSWEDSWDDELTTLNLVDGSFIEFRSSEQMLVKHAGTSRHFIHFDEEPPHSIFNENLLRLADVNGEWWITMTPVDGMTWTFYDLYEKRNLLPNLDIVEVFTTDNPFASPEGVENALVYLDADERQARMQGRFMAKGGLVFKDFMESLHVIPDFDWHPGPGAKIYTSTDHGVNNPTCWLWHAVDEQGNIITFSEHYQSDLTIKQHSAIVHQRESDLGLNTYLRTGDPAMKQRTAESGMSILQLYALEGLPIAVEGVPKEVSIGVERMRQYMKVNPATGRPRWMITQNCEMLIKQLKQLAWKTYESSKLRDANNATEQIKKKDDHAPDSARYFFTLMPELTPGDIVPVAEAEPTVHKPLTMLDYYLKVSEPDFGADIPKPVQWQTKKSFDMTSEFNFEGA